MTKSGAPTASAGELPVRRLDEEGWPVLKPTLLTIHRTSTEDVKTRQVIFSLDGKKSASCCTSRASRARSRRDDIRCARTTRSCGARCSSMPSPAQRFTTAA